MTEANRNTQIKIMRFIDSYRVKRGYSPSVCEIADNLGLKGSSSVMYHLKTMRNEGKIDWDDGVRRSYQVIKYPEYKIQG